MGTGKLVIDKDAGWQDITIRKGRDTPNTVRGWVFRMAGYVFRGLAWLVALIAGFMVVNWLLTIAAVPPLWLWAEGLPWVSLSVALALCAGFGAWFWFASESFDIRISTPLRKWVRRRRYRAKWADVMVGSGLTVKNSRRREHAPGIVRIRQGRFC